MPAAVSYFAASTAGRSRASSQSKAIKTRSVPQRGKASQWSSVTPFVP
ncbi:MAG: hypothetical protein AB1486_34190 [Planctomycetota bacterium]